MTLAERFLLLVTLSEVPLMLRWWLTMSGLLGSEATMLRARNLFMRNENRWEDSVRGRECEMRARLINLEIKGTCVY